MVYQHMIDRSIPKRGLVKILYMQKIGNDNTTFSVEQKRDIGEALSRAQGHGMDSFVASLACLKEKMCCGLRGWYITCDRTNLTGFIFQERQTFHWDCNSFCGKKHVISRCQTLKKHHPRLTLRKHCAPYIFLFVPSITSSRSQSFCKTSAGIKASVRMAPLRFFAWRMVLVK